MQNKAWSIYTYNFMVYKFIKFADDIFFKRELSEP